jgi:tetratricopeptide (TPR) repeat protein
LRAGETEGIVESLDAALNRKHPQVDLLTLLAGLKLKAEQLDEAAKLYRLGAEKFPGDSKWQKMLAQLFLKMGNDEKLYGCLEELAKLDFDDSTSRKKLAELALARKDFAAAERWCREVLQIDVMDANIHHTLAEALVAQDKHAGAIEEYGFAIRIAPEHSDWQSALEKLRTQRNPN